jgi:hypothetical protein
MWDVGVPKEHYGLQHRQGRSRTKATGRMLASVEKPASSGWQATLPMIPERSSFFKNFIKDEKFGNINF